MLHGPLTASNLLVTWRRRHGDGRITRQSAGSREGSWINLIDETPWGSKFQQGAKPPWSLCWQHLPGEDERIGEEWKRRYPEMVWNHLLLFLTTLKTSPRMCFGKHFKLYITRVFLLFFWWNLQTLEPVNKTSSWSYALSTFCFPPSPSGRQWTVREANWEGRADQGCLFICLYVLLEL